MAYEKTAPESKIRRIFDSGAVSDSDPVPHDAPERGDSAPVARRESRLRGDARVRKPTRMPTTERIMSINDPFEHPEVHGRVPSTLPGRDRGRRLGAVERCWEDRPDGARPPRREDRESRGRPSREAPQEPRGSPSGLLAPVSTTCTMRTPCARRARSVAARDLRRRGAHGPAPRRPIRGPSTPGCVHDYPCAEQMPG